MSTMDKNAEELASSVIKDVFNITGQKVGIDDPIVTAALVQSRLITESSKNAASALKKSTDESMSALIADLKKTFQKLESAQLEQTKKALDRIKSEAGTPPVKMKAGILLCSLALTLLGSFAGYALAVLSSGSPRSDTYQDAVTEAGKDFLLILPRLSEAQRKMLAKEIELAKKDTRK